MFIFTPSPPLEAMALAHVPLLPRTESARPSTSSPLCTSYLYKLTQLKMQSEIEAFVREEEARLQALIQQEIEAQAKLGAERLLFRVVVTNIAADAGEEELWDIFNEFNV
jgi:hypothetical protein